MGSAAVECPIETTVGPICLPDRPHSADFVELADVPRKLLDGHRCAGGLELGLRVLGGVLVDLLEQRLGGAVDEILGLLEAQAGHDLADDLDDADLLLAGTLEDDVELGLLLGSLGRGTGGAGGGGGGPRGRGDVEGLLERLDELRELQQGQFLERVEQVFGAELGHDVVLSLLTYLLGGLGSAYSAVAGASVSASAVAGASASAAAGASATAGA